MEGVGRGGGEEEGGEVVGGGDGEGLAELPRAGEKGARVERGGLLAAGVHRVHAGKRFGGADEYGGCDAVGVCDDVEHEVVAVGEVDVRQTGHAEDRPVAGCAGAVGVAGGVVGCAVGFGFDDACAEVSADQVCAQE